MNLKTEIDFDIKRFFQWWGKELINCLPEQFRQKLSKKSAYVFLSVNGEFLEIEPVINGKSAEKTMVPLNDGSIDDYQKLITDSAELEKAECILRLRADQGIKKVLYLPTATKENIREVVSFEMDRITPFNAEQIYYEVKVLGKEEHGKINVLLVLTPKVILDKLYQQLKSVNIFPAIVDYSEAVNDFEQDLAPYNLLPEKDRPIKSKATQIITWSLSAAATLLFALVLLFPIWKQEQAIESLRQQLKSLKKDTQEVQENQLAIDEIIEETEGLIKIKNTAPSLIEISDILSQLLPNDTWLTHFKFSKEKIQVQGQSPSASVLISILESSPLFENARFVSPLTQDKRTGMERFQISMTVNSAGGLKDE